MANNLIFLSSTIIVALFSLGCVKMKPLLIAWIALLGVLSNLFVLKEIQLFGLHATASDVFAVGSLLGLNLLREHYDINACKQAIGISFVCMFFFMLMSQIHLLYIPSEFDQRHDAYFAILAPNFRLTSASLAVFFSVQIFDVAFYSHLVRKWFKSFYMRSMCSLIVSQTLDTILFTFLGLHGLVDNLGEIIIISLIIKIIAITCMSPFTMLSKRWVQA